MFNIIMTFRLTGPAPAIDTLRSSTCLILGLLFALAVMTQSVVAQENSSREQQEYFVHQNADEALLIRINTFEADFEVSLLDPEGRPLLVSKIGNSRLVPVFQFVNAVRSPRQLDIRVFSDQNTRRSKFSLGLTRITIWDDRSERLAQAYQNLSFGAETLVTETPANWTVKINSLIKAAGVFQSMGMKELGAWSTYLAAHLIHFHLHDYSIALDMIRDILADLKGSRWQEIILATLQLQSDTLIKLREAGSMRVSASGADKVQTALLQVAELAKSMDFQYERALAIKKSGAEYASRSMYPQALEQFQLALEIAESIGDDKLATAIRESIVQVHTNQGDTPASGTVLREIEAQLTTREAGEALAVNLLQQGRLLMSGYQYTQAINVLLQALEHENDSATRRQINFELARALYESGDWGQSLGYVLAAQVYRGPGIVQRPNSTIDIGEGLRILANIYRTQTNFSQMKQVRRAQGQFIRSGLGTTGDNYAGYLYEKGLDERTQGISARGRAQALFRQSYEAAAGGGWSPLEHLSRLQFCALMRPVDKALAFCSPTATRKSYDALHANGSLRQVVEAMYLRAKFLVTRGKHNQAITLLDGLVAEVHFLRDTLPGGLGAWYWQRAETIFEFYLTLLMTAEEQGGVQDEINGLQSLLALSRIRFAMGPSPAPGDLAAEVEQLRVSLTQSDGRNRPGDASSTKKHDDKQMESLRSQFRQRFRFLSKTGVQKHVRGLNKNEAVLTYHITPSAAHLWIAGKGRITRRRLAGAQAIQSTLQAARNGLSGVGGAAFEQQIGQLGKYLIAPVADSLPETIYLIPAGPLLGFPLDAIRHDGHYLAEHHNVVNLMSFPARPRPSEYLRVGSTKPREFFLAGHPQDYVAGYASQLETSTEVQAVARIFVGPGLHIVQGRALLADEFHDPRFQRADLVHLAMPGVIDPQHPGHSSLELSEAGRGLGRESIGSADIQKFALKANLVFLSATRIGAGPSGKFEHRLGIVSGFLDAGAQAVVSSLWTSDGDVGKQFVADFYHRLNTSGNIVTALADTKRQYLVNPGVGKPADWAGLQLFTK